MKRIALAALLALAAGCAETVDTPAREAGHAQDPAHKAGGDADSVMPIYPSTTDWEHATASQKARAERSFAELRARQVPVYQGSLVVDDDGEAVLQTAQDVARRTLILWAVELRAEGVPREEARGIIDHLDLWEYVSPDEQRFLDQQNPSRDESRQLVWRLEGLWVLMWALGYIDDLNWPGGMCDVETLAGLIAEHESDPSFISEAQLRPAGEILDAQDLTMRIHWAVRDAQLHQGGMVPQALDWSGDPEFMPVTMCAAVGVMEERHYVLNWLVNYPSATDWDDVDTPT